MATFPFSPNDHRFPIKQYVEDMVALVGGGGSPGPSVQYACPTGNDANDGLTWATAKKTVLAAYDALPTWTGGTINVGDQTEIGGEVAGQGLWMVGPQMPNYNDGDRLPGWRKAKPLKIVGHGGILTTFGMPPQVRLIPSGSPTWQGIPLNYTGATSGITFDGIYLGGSGLAVNIARFGSHRPDGSLISDNTGGGVTAQIFMRNTTFDNAMGGPTMMVGWTFFAWMHQLVLLVNGAYALNTDARAAYKAISPTGGYAYVGFKECRISGGNFVHQCAQGGLLFDDVLFENPIGDAGVVLKLDQDGRAGGVFRLRLTEFADLSLPKGAIDNSVKGVIEATLDNVTINGSPAGALVLNDITSIPPGIQTVTKIDTGTAYHALGQYPATRQGAIGLAGRLWGHHSAAARLQQPTQIRFANLSSPLTGGAGATGPDGIANAAVRYTDPTYTTHSLYNAVVTPSVGDAWIVAAWTKDSLIGPGGGHRIVFSPTNFDINYGAAGTSFGGPPEMPTTQDMWDIHKFLIVCTALGAGAPKNLSIALEALGSGGVSDYTVYLPTVVYIPASAMNPNELAEYFTHFVPQPIGPAVGSLAYRPGQRIAMFDVTANQWKYLYIDSGAVVIA